MRRRNHSALNFQAHQVCSWYEPLINYSLFFADALGVPLLSFFMLLLLYLTDCTFFACNQIIFLLTDL